jgi:hypothetical protein
VVFSALSLILWHVGEGAIGLGQKKPMASNVTEEGRAKNRRGEVTMPTGEARQQLPPNTKQLSPCHARLESK